MADIIGKIPLIQKVLGNVNLPVAIGVAIGSLAVILLARLYQKYGCPDCYKCCPLALGAKLFSGVKSVVPKSVHKALSRSRSRSTSKGKKKKKRKSSKRRKSKRKVSVRRRRRRRSQ
eukprot:158866_1